MKWFTELFNLGTNGTKLVYIGYALIGSILVVTLYGLYTSVSSLFTESDDTKIERLTINNKTLNTKVKDLQDEAIVDKNISDTTLKLVVDYKDKDIAITKNTAIVMKQVTTTIKLPKVVVNNKRRVVKTYKIEEPIKTDVPIELKTIPPNTTYTLNKKEYEEFGKANIDAMYKLYNTLGDLK